LFTHIDIDDPITLGDFVGSGLNLVFEVHVRRQISLINTVTRHIKLPAVINTPDPVLFVPPKKERSTPVRTTVVHDPHTTRGIAKCDELFAQEHQPHGITVSLQF
jgi:hypothetical protein